jgi:hypothetical protein
VIELIGRQTIVAADDGWSVVTGDFRRDIWHGAAVISSRDECLIGVLVVVDDQPKIIPLSSSHLP